MKSVDPVDVRVLLADDDDDDRLLFLDVLKELPRSISLAVAGDGEQLMKMLTETGSKLPDVLFLDLNMPLKNGFECLSEIRSNKKLLHLPVIIFSTSSQPSAIEQVYEGGADLYIRKPNDFTQLRRVIEHVLAVNWKKVSTRPPKEEFVLAI